MSGDASQRWRGAFGSARNQCPEVGLSALEVSQLRVLVIGATGLIGSAVAAHLAAHGHMVVAASRSGRSLGLTPSEPIAIDLATANAGQWRPVLDGIDAVVNCAGILQDSPAESTQDVHVNGLSELLKACQSAGIRRFVHLSAAGVHRDTPSAFSQTKLRGEQLIQQHDLDWIILRPSVVIGPAAYGGSALVRGLASLPVLPVMPNTGALQPVHLSDVVLAVAFFLRSDAPSRQAYDLAGPETFSFHGLVQLFRKWLRWPRQKPLRLPAIMATATYSAGDWLAYLGWQSPISTTARKEIVRGAVGDSEPLAKLGLRPRSLAAELSRQPASVQERWFAAMYVIKPALFIVVALFWILTGVIALGPGWHYGMGLMAEGGVTEEIAALTVVAGAAADIIIGLMIAYRPTARYGLWAAILIALAYAIIGTILVPRLWADPLGPMLKIWPVIMLHLVALAILEDR